MIPRKTMTVQEAGWLGARAKAASTTPEQRQVITRKAGVARWADSTPEERSAHARMMAAAPRKPRKKVKPPRPKKKRGPWPKKREDPSA